MTTAQDEIIERVVSYIRHNAAKEPQAIRELVQKGHEQLVALIDGLSEEQARFQPGPDDWCVLEVLRHVVFAKRGVARVCAGLARGERPAGLGGEGEQQDGIVGEAFPTLAAARSALDAAHQELISFIEGPLAQGDLRARYRHFLFGELNCREWAAFQRVHDVDHVNQIGQIKASPGFPR